MCLPSTLPAMSDEFGRRTKSRGSTSPSLFPAMTNKKRCRDFGEFIVITSSCLTHQRGRRFHEDFCWIRGLLPLDGCGGFTGDVVDDAAHLRYLSCNLLADFIHKLGRKPGPIRRHPVYTTYRT